MTRRPRMIRTTPEMARFKHGSSLANQGCLALSKFTLIKSKQALTIVALWLNAETGNQLIVVLCARARLVSCKRAQFQILDCAVQRSATYHVIQNYTPISFRSIANFLNLKIINFWNLWKLRNFEGNFIISKQINKYYRLPSIPTKGPILFEILFLSYFLFVLSKLI